MSPEQLYFPDGSTLGTHYCGLNVYRPGAIMICAACMTPQKCGELGCKVLHPENHPPRSAIDSGLGHALNVADPDEAHENALREERMRPKP